MNALARALAACRLLQAMAGEPTTDIWSAWYVPEPRIVAQDEAAGCIVDLGDSFMRVTIDAKGRTHRAPVDVDRLN